MKDLTLISSDSSRVFNAVRAEKFIVKAPPDADLVRINHDIRAAQNNLTAMLVRTDKTVPEVDYRDEWRGLPIVLYTQGLGKIRDIWEKLDQIKALDLVIFLPAEDRKIFRSIAFLSSLGIKCGFRFSNNGDPAWEDLIDLLYFTFYPRVARASIQPFEFIKDHNIVSSGINYGEVFFNNPEKYVWVDENKRIALSEEGLKAGRFIDTDITDIHRIEQDPAYQAALLAWQEHFLNVDRCSACPGWRICHGFHQDHCTDGHIEFFEEVLSVVTDARTGKNKGKAIWQ